MACKYAWYWWLLDIVVFLVGLGGLIAILVMFLQAPPDFTYGVVIDAGSSSSKLYSYKWDSERTNGTAVAVQASYCKTSPGISSFASDPPSAGESLVQCMDQLEGNIIPGENHDSTNQYLGATAGMRLLEAADKPASDEIIVEVRKTMETYPFSITDADNDIRILPGDEEGAFGWITANYLSGKFTELSLLNYVGVASVKDTFGALDMGGASTQITFVPEDASSIQKENRAYLELYGGPYEVYTHSYLCYGSAEARKQHFAALVQASGYASTVDVACMPTGTNVSFTHSELFYVPCTEKWDDATKVGNTYTLVGTSDDKACRDDVMEIFNFTASCASPPCAFNGISQPPINGQFYAFASYYNTLAFLNQTDRDNYTLNDFQTAYSNFCELTWAEVLEIPHSDSTEKYMPEYCFNAHYINIILTQGYGFDETTWGNILFRDKIDGNNLGWSLGFMLNTSNTLPLLTSSNISLNLFVILLVIFTLFIILSLVFMCCACVCGKKVESTKIASI